MNNVIIHFKTIFICDFIIYVKVIRCLFMLFYLFSNKILLKTHFDHF